MWPALVVRNREERKSTSSIIVVLRENGGVGSGIVALCVTASNFCTGNLFVRSTRLQEDILQVQIQILNSLDRFRGDNSFCQEPLIKWYNKNERNLQRYPR